MRKIIYTRPDGGVSVISVPIDKDEALATAMALLPPEALNARIVDEVIIPANRTFRNAWRQDGMTVRTDMPLARELWRDHLRRLRAPKLAALDTAYLLADETGNQQEKARIAAQKRVLRDVTSLPDIEAAQTPDELKAVMPPELL